MAYAREEQVTGEGVAVELPVAGIVPRIAARLIDLAVSAALGLVLFLGASVLGLITGGASGAVARIAILLIIVVVILVYPVTLETLTRGKSVGKYAVGLRTVRDDGGPITARQSLARALTAWVEIWLSIGGPAVISAIVTQRAKRLGDVVAGTYVITERHSVNLTTPPHVPPGLEGWVTHADLAPLPTGLALAVRQFLSRTERFTPEARYAQGQSLLAEVLPLVAPPPPPGWHAEYVLAAVLADRRRRDLERLRREQALRERVVGSGSP